MQAGRHPRGAAAEGAEISFGGVYLRLAVGASSTAREAFGVRFLLLLARRWRLGWHEKHLPHQRCRRDEGGQDCFRRVLTYSHTPPLQLFKERGNSSGRAKNVVRGHAAPTEPSPTNTPRRHVVTAETQNTNTKHTVNSLSLAW